MRTIVICIILLFSELCLISEAAAFIGQSAEHTLHSEGFVVTGDVVGNEHMNTNSIVSLSSMINMNSEAYSVVTKIIDSAEVAPLELVVTTPQNNIHTEDAVIMIEGTVNQDNVNISINSVEIPLNGKSFSYAYMLQLKENVIHVKAEKGAGVDESFMTVWRDVGAIQTCEDMLLTVKNNFDKLYDLEATLLFSDMYNNVPLIGSLWSRIYFKSPDSIRIDNYSDSSMIAEYSIFVLRDGILYNKTNDINIHESDIAVFADLNESEYRQINIPFDITAFIQGHELTLESFNETEQVGWLTAVPQTFSDLYSKMRLCVDCVTGVIIQMEVFVNDVLTERTEVVDVVAIEGSYLPKSIRKTSYLPRGHYISDYVFEDIEINQGLGDALFFLN